MCDYGVGGWGGGRRKGWRTSLNRREGLVNKWRMTGNAGGQRGQRGKLKRCSVAEESLKERENESQNKRL